MIKVTVKVNKIRNRKTIEKKMVKPKVGSWKTSTKLTNLE
jgi:hypothetical protein